MSKEGIAVDTMKAALYDGETMQVSVVPKPEVHPGAVIVRVRAVGVDDVGLPRQDEPGELGDGCRVQLGPGVDGDHVDPRRQDECLLPARRLPPPPARPVPVQRVVLWVQAPEQVE